MSLTPCLDCGTPTRGNRCPKHARTHNRRRTAKSKAHRLDARWRKHTRPAVLARDRGLCRLRLRGCTTLATTVHRLPKFGPVHDENLDAYVSACAHCHGAVDAPRAHR